MSQPTTIPHPRAPRIVTPLPRARDLLALDEPPLPPNIDAKLLNAMSLRVQKRGGTERLSGAEVERALLSGEHARTLETYFGEAEYQELRQLAGRATRRTRDAGPRVLIVPGILGSMLAQVNGAKSDTLWVDLIDIVLGRLGRLALPGVGRQFRAVDVHLATYLKLKLWLQSEGFDADFHPFDWRQSIPELGRQFADRIDADPASEIFIVAHSMGGLVARAALKHAAEKKVSRLVMLGTPNFGSFAPAMVYRSVYPFLNKIAALDLKHNVTELAGKIFNTHPGLAEMLPHASRFNRVDLFDLDQWPSSGARPLRSILAGVPAAHQALSVLPEKFVMIAGVDRETTVNLRVDGPEFVFERSRAGDGTVPLEFAVLPDVLTYYHAEEHGALPRNATIHRAVVDILRHGSTTVLSDRWERSRGDACIEISETDLRAKLEASTRKRGEEFSASDLRTLFAEFAAPTLPGTPVSSDGAASAALIPPAANVFESLVVGRRRQRRIDVRLARGSVTQVKSRAYLLGQFQNVAPAGAALAVDELMEGTLSEFRHRRMFSGAAGEVLLLPGGRNRVMADYIVFVGLGHFDSFNLQVLETVAENVARTLARVDIEEFATVPIGASTGLEVEDAMRALLRGFFRGLDDADQDHAFRGITFCEVDDVRYDLLKWTLYRLWSTSLCEGVEVTMGELKLPPAPVARRAGPGGVPPSMYLNVRARREGSSLKFESSLLTMGAKAAVLSGTTRVPAAELTSLLAEIEESKFTHGYLPRFGEVLARRVLHDSVAAALEGTSGNHLVIVHDAEASRIPWETMCLNGIFPALSGGISRRYIADNLSVAKWLEQRRLDDWLDVLLVINPTQDLAGAEQEGNRIQQLFNASQQVHLTVIRGAAATRARLRTEFSSGKYDILHYAGHAFFDPQQRARSGLVCSDGHLTGAELVEIGHLPSLVFFNACESARVRKQVVRESTRVSRDIQERIDRSVGLAEAFLRGGVANYIGTYWPVGDDPAKTFAGTFYERVLAGDTLLAALSKARADVNKITSPDWADYLFYGSADFAVKTARAG